MITIGRNGRLQGNWPLIHRTNMQELQFQCSIYGHVDHLDVPEMASSCGLGALTDTKDSLIRYLESMMLSARNIVSILLVFFSYGSFSQSKAPKRYSERVGIAYYLGPNVDTANQKLNLVIPKNVIHPPLLIWIGGGAWSYVNRNMEMDLARRIAEEGIAVASVGHRLSPATWKDSSLNVGIRHPEHIRDIARAVSYLYSNADIYGYSREEIFVGGFSSGGHLAALIVMDNKYLRHEGLSKDLIKGVLPIAGTYDIQHYYQVLAEGNGSAFADNHIGSVFGLTMQDFKDASPSTYLDSLSTPMLLISETNTFKYTRFFEDMLRARDYKQFEVLHVHRLSHGQLWKNLSYSDKSIYRDLIIDFIKRNSMTEASQP